MEPLFSGENETKTKRKSTRAGNYAKGATQSLRSELDKKTVEKNEFLEKALSALIVKFSNSMTGSFGG